MQNDIVHTGRGNQLRTVCYPAVFLLRAVEAD